MESYNLEEIKSTKGDTRFKRVFLKLKGSRKVLGEAKEILPHFYKIDPHYNLQKWEVTVFALHADSESNPGKDATPP